MQFARNCSDGHKIACNGYDSVVDNLSSFLPNKKAVFPVMHYTSVVSETGKRLCTIYVEHRTFCGFFLSHDSLVP